MRTRVLALLLALLAAVLPVHAEWTPTKTNRLVNDYSGILSSEQVGKLENRLVALDDSTSNQILVVITPTLGGDEIKAVGQRIGQAWGVGQKEYSNGLVIIIKSKSEDEPDGDVVIVTGYGLEGALPDVFCKRIIENQMVPHLAEGEYYEALDEALNVIEPVVKGEYDYERYKSDNRDLAPLFGLLGSMIVMVVIICLLHKSLKKGGGSSGNSNSSGGTHLGGFGSGFGGPFSSGSSFGSGSFGGFGGFGGGSFGGGGASGKF
ncbi:MAG: TPM domain-containing protein [Bacteroidales bacterium]|nr:TPM domain-containing protein [Bacteroidales bacterium]